MTVGRVPGATFKELLVPLLAADVARSLGQTTCLGNATRMTIRRN